ncbi:DsrE family protein [Bacillus sp. ISL-41]|uniref:DsrE family protein n=1 Tax=Bacillus sp. ISL-41 TaxID=2819127 RepID=UPI001BE997C7|nr:DsrE family protein [Bacillus sp. ISL-41]MBT2642276.1 DsrE family protein [Bacillus sp. ISL-41]
MREKIIFIVMTALLLTTSLSWAAAKTDGETGRPDTTPQGHYQVVWQVTDPAGTNESNWAGVLNNVENSLAEIGEDKMEIEVVAFGAGIHMLSKEKSSPELQERIRKLQERGVVFAACANSMAKNGYEMEDMIDGAVQVPSGAAEVIRKQRQGWIYMRS